MHNLLIYQPLDYGNSTNAIQLPVNFEVLYSGINISSGRNTVMCSPYVITLPAVDGSIIVTVRAFNDFGVGGFSLAAEDTISKISKYQCECCTIVWKKLIYCFQY